MGTSHTSPGKPNYRGLDLEKTSPFRSRQNFFLDIPFDRTYWHKDDPSVTACKCPDVLLTES